MREEGEGQGGRVGEGGREGEGEEDSEVGRVRGGSERETEGGRETNAEIRRRTEKQRRDR